MKLLTHEEQKTVPHVCVKMQDGAKEVLTIRLELMRDMWSKGGQWFNGYVPKPTDEELAIIGGSHGIDGGHMAMEIITCWMYEGGEALGIVPDADDTDEDSLHRPFRYEYRNHKLYDWE